MHYAVEHPNHYLLIFGDTRQLEPDADIDAAGDQAMSAVTRLIERTTGEDERARISVRERATILWTALHGIAQLQITGLLQEPRTLDGDTRLDELVVLAASVFHTPPRP